MQFISTMKQQSYTFDLARSEVKETSVGNVVVNHRGKRIQFEPLMEPFETPTLVGKRKKAWGILDTEKASRDTGIDEKDIIEFLMAHKAYGIKHVGIGHDGGEVISEEAYVVPEGETGYFCKLCDKHIKNVQGMKNHVKSNTHVEAVEVAKVEALANVR